MSGMDFEGVVRSNSGVAAADRGGRPEGPPDPEVAAKSRATCGMLE